MDKRLAPHLNNVVLVEGGVRVIKKYKRLMLRRIKWSEQVKNGDDQKDVGSDSEESEVKESLDQKCHLIWEGVTNQPIFGDKLKVVYDVRTEMEGRKPFLDKKCEYLWD